MIIEKLLTKLIDRLDTKQLANIFKSYMEDKNINKFDGRRKDNNSTYLIYGEDERWDRVFCIHYDKEELEDLKIVLRKNAGCYLIISNGSRVVFESNFNGSRTNTYFDRLLFVKVYINYKPLFDELFKLI